MLWPRRMRAVKKHNNTTITLSIPHDTKAFLEQLYTDGYNRSNLMLKMIDIIEVLYTSYPQVPLPWGLTRLRVLVDEGLLLTQFKEGLVKQEGVPVRGSPKELS